MSPGGLRFLAGLAPRLPRPVFFLFVFFLGACGVGLWEDSSFLPPTQAASGQLLRVPPANSEASREGNSRSAPGPFETAFPGARSPLPPAAPLTPVSQTSAPSPVFGAP